MTPDIDEALKKHRAGRLDDRTRVFEDVANRGAGLVRIDRNDLVDQFPAQPEGLVADAAHSDTVGEDTYVFESDRRTVRE